MYLRYAIIMLLGILVLLTWPFPLGVRFSSGLDNRHHLPESAGELHSPEDWMYRQRAYPHGWIRKDIYLQAMSQWQSLNNARSGFGPAWEPVGATGFGGRISSLAVHPNDDKIIYIGAASGGVFKTTDNGQSWSPVFDQAASLSIGDLALAPSDPRTIYVGTGEANAGGGSLAYDGAGMYKSTNSGKSWTPAGLENTGSIGKVLIHPQQAGTVYVAAMGSLFANNPERGLYRTTNGGAGWQQILYVSDSTGMIDLAMHPSNPKIIFAASWERVRRPNRRQYGGPTSRIYRSTDGGDEWEQLPLPLPDGAMPGRIGLAISPLQPHRLYASVVNGENDFLLGIYRSDNLGQTWTSLPLEGIVQVPFMWWFGKIYADPVDAGRIYLCGLELYQYQEGREAWETIMPGIHVDQHAVFLEPKNRSYLLVGNDGGLYRGTGDFLSSGTYFDKLPITQFYTSEIDYQTPERLLGGTQDNGCLRRDPATGYWERILGNDGFVTLVDPLHPQYVYAASQYGNLRRSANGGNTFSNGTPVESLPEIKNWNTPVVLDPVEPIILYYGAQRVYRSTDRGINWQAISPVLTTAPAGSNLAYGTISTLAVSPADPRIIYAGADNGAVFVTKDLGKNWTEISQLLPNRWVTRISAHPSDPDIAYATFSGYRWQEYLPHVFRTGDQGSTWEDRSGSLPEVPVNDLVINPEKPEQLFLATDAGVFISEDEGQSWDILGSDLPKVVVTDLTYHAPTQTLVAATYGRSMYSLSLAGPSSWVDRPATSFRLKAFPNPFNEQATIRIELERSTTLTIEVFDLTGRLIQQLFQGRLSPGEHLFTFRPPVPASYVCQVNSAGDQKSLLLLHR